MQSIRDGQKQDNEEQNHEGQSHCEQHWQEWVLFMLRGVEETAKTSLDLVEKISLQMQEFKRVVRPALDKQYSHELMNHLFSQPYTKISHLENALQISRRTATKRLECLVELGVLEKQKRGRHNYYINTGLYQLFQSYQAEGNRVVIDSIFSDTSPAD